MGSNRSDSRNQAYAVLITVGIFTGLGLMDYAAHRVGSYFDKRNIENSSPMVESRPSVEHEEMMRSLQDPLDSEDD